MTAPRGIPVIGLYYVGRVNPAAMKHPRVPMDADLRQAFAENDFIYLDYYNEMRRRLFRRKTEESTDYWVIKDRDGHPNIEGHDFIARLFLGGLRKAGILQKEWMEERLAHTASGDQDQCIEPETVPPQS